MSDQPMPGAAPEAGEPRCPWCSALLLEAGAVTCPNCGASLTESEAADVPGLTKIDPEAILRSRTPSQKSRGLIGWLAGEYREQPAADPKSTATFAPPDDEVRREMIRLELAALEAQAEGRRAELDLERAEATLAAAGSNAGDGTNEAGTTAEILELDEPAL